MLYLKKEKSMLIDLSNLHSFSLKAGAQKIISLRNNEHFSAGYLSDVLRQYPKYWILGSGSNTIFCRDFLGVILKIENCGIELLSQSLDHYYVRVAAGEIWHAFVLYCLEQSWHGLENLSLIPGTVGAAPIQNIGAYGVEIESYIEHVECIDLHSKNFEKVIFTREACCFGYRDSIFKRNVQRYLITHVVFRLDVLPNFYTSYGDLYTHLPEHFNAQDVVNAIIMIRRSKLPDPVLLPNAGSFFKNPWVDESLWTQLKKQYPELPGYLQSCGSYKVSAGWLIDRLGLKGYEYCGIAIHDQQALVLVNKGAHAASLEHMIQYIQGKIQETYGVDLEVEPNMVY